ncbi:hypothetical protein R6Q57_029633 [Mikania cordata]
MKDDSTATSTACGHCGLSDRKILHHVRLTGTFRRLCTTCVLRLHPKSFCPSCLIVYHRSPPDNSVVCYRCHSSSHRTCVSPSVTGRTPCATCLNPNALVFEYKSCYWSSNNKNPRIDLSAARLLVAAAEISSMSMSKAEAAAVTEADWRANEASNWRKKAKEAVNHVVKLMEIEQKKRGDDHKAVVVDVDGNCNKKFATIPVVNTRIDDGNGSIEVSEALNAVKLSGESVCRMMEI